MKQRGDIVGCGIYLNLPFNTGGVVWYSAVREVLPEREVSYYIMSFTERSPKTLGHFLLIQEALRHRSAIPRYLTLTFYVNVGI